jgi:hypothetical protein
MEAFSEADSLGNQPPEAIADYLELIGDAEGARAIRKAAGLPEPRRWYRKTALVEAQQFLPPDLIPEGVYQKGTMGDVASGHGEWVLDTLEGQHDLRRGDYICTGPAGERWNVAQDIFEATYELVRPTDED